MTSAAPLGLSVPDLTPYLPAILFYAFAGIAILSAIMAATAPRIVHAAFGLMATFFGVAAMYAMLGADFLALSQVIIYVGGILVLLVFGILLTGRVRGALGLERPERLGYGVAAGAVIFFGLLLSLGASRFNTVAEPPADPEPTTAPIGRAFLDPGGYLVPFELASILLLGALVGAAYLARRRRES